MKRLFRRVPGWLVVGAVAGLSLSAAAQTNLITLAPDGAYTWYNDPRALFHNGNLYFGCVRSDGETTLSMLDLQTGALPTLWTSTWSQYDDHDNPGLLSLEDGRILAIYARHSSANTFSYRRSISASPVNAGLWGGEQTIPSTGAGVTYANPYQLAAESGKVYNFCRDLNFNPTVLTSTDAGNSWSTPQLFIKTGTGSIRPYVKYCSDYFSRVDFLYTDGHPRDVNNSLYHAYYRGGAVYKTDGTLVKSFGELPLLHDSGERGSVIYQYNTADTSDFNDHIPAGRAWCWEITYQTHTMPACVFTVQRDQVTGSSWSDDRIYYYYARWTGTNWQKRFIAHAGRPLYQSEDDYAGGIALDPEDPTVVYISSDAANPFDLATITNVPLGPHFELYKGVTTNGGLTFAWTAITTNSAVDNFRPYIPRNRQGRPALIWFRGSYPTFTSFHTSVVGLFTNSFPRADMIACWPLDAAVGGVTPELALGSSLTITGGAGTVPGVFSNAFSFDGVSQYLSASHSPAGTNGLPIYQSGRPFTIAGWVRGAPQTAKYIFAEGNTTNNSPLFLLQSGQSASVNNRLDILLRNTAGSTLINHAVSTRAVLDGAWHHFAYVDNAGAVQLYIDGQADTNFTYTPSGSFAFGTASVGALVRAAASGLFAGSVDDVVAWGRVLTQAEVRGVMSNSIPIPASTPPSIAQQTSGSTNSMGAYVMLSTQVQGDSPLSYQWFQNGFALSSRTNLNLVAPTSVAGTNFFTLVVTNAAGAATSAPIRVVILPDPPANLSEGLVSFWPLDSVENIGGNLRSPDVYSRNDLALNFMDANNLATGRFGNALSFDGIQQYAQRTSGFPIYLTTNYSVSFWVNGAPGQFNRQVFAEGGAGGDFFLIGTENSASPGASLNVKISPGLTDTKSSRAVFDDSWHHVVWVDEQGRARLYIDGILDDTYFSYARSAISLESTSIGTLVRTTPVNFFSGSIDSVAVWDRALTFTEIQQVMTNGIRPLPSPIPPSIFAQPIDRTNGVFAGDAVSFSVVTSGTGPLGYQWFKDAIAIPLAANQSAASSMLSLTSVQLADAGSYSVVVSNAAGSVTSSVARLAVVTYTPVTNGTALQVDFDLTGSPNAYTGFRSFTLAANGSAFDNEVAVTVSPIGNISVAERLRSAAPWVLNNPPALTQAQIYNDFDFANSTADGTGLSILISRLSPDTPYGLTVWSYDPQSPGIRVSDWTETASGGPIPIATGYAFNGSTPPTADYDYTFGALLMSSSAGELKIEGVRHGGTSYGVFVNALQLVANPALQVAAVSATPNGNVRLFVELQYPGQAIAFEESATLAAGSWHTAPDVTTIQSAGPRVVAEFPASANRMFYRVVRLSSP